jgi:type II secretory pathway component PulK
MKYTWQLKPQAGVALIVVLLLVAILSIAVSGFVYDVRINSVLTRNHQERLEARYVAEAGINAAKGLLMHSAPFDEQYRSNFQNQFINLFHCECMGEGGATLGLTEEQAEDQQQVLSSQANCGAWSMDINYPIGENLLNLRLTDEQSRLNLNALVRKSSNPEEDGVRVNPLFRPVLFELFSLRLRQLNIEHTDQDIEAILDLLADWMDYGTMDGSFDNDTNDFFEDRDRIYSNKNGPMDTVSELRMIPLVNDELYHALKDLVTVYPYDPAGQSFSARVNIHLAGREVLFALLRGATYENDQPAFSEDEVMARVNDMIQQGMGETGFLQNRQVPPEFKQAVNTTTFELNTRVPQSRFYRVRSSGVTPGGIIHTIETVIRVDPGRQNLVLLYWRED